MLLTFSQGELVRTVSSRSRWSVSAKRRAPSVVNGTAHDQLAAHGAGSVHRRDRLVAYGAATWLSPPPPTTRPPLGDHSTTPLDLKSSRYSVGKSARVQRTSCATAIPACEPEAWPRP